MTNTSASKEERHAMMNSMMEQFFGGMSADEKQEMCATMMGMMSDSSGNTSGGMADMTSKTMHCGCGQHMPQMMLEQMMPHCIAMMLPMIEPDKRGEIGAAILSALIETGSVGMSDEQMRAFLKALDDVMNPAA